MHEALIFDVDGTLTSARSMMLDEMARMLRHIIAHFPVFLVTGSDIGKLEGQVPQDILETAAGLFCCSGNEMWCKGHLIYQMRHAFADELISFVEALLAASPYRVRTGNHIEERTGSLNVSVVGRNASMLQRKNYNLHDRADGERLRLISAIEERFPQYEASRGGQISIDIAPRGWNKARVLKEVHARLPDAAVQFFGDTISHGGNDLPLAAALLADSTKHSVNPVKDPHETLALLKKRYGTGVLSSEVA